MGAESSEEVKLGDLTFTSQTRVFMFWFEGVGGGMGGWGDGGGVFLGVCAIQADKAQLAPENKQGGGASPAALSSAGSIRGPGHWAALHAGTGHHRTALMH